MEENMTTLNTSQEIVDSSSTANDRPAFNPDSIGLIHDRDENYTEIDTSDKTIKTEANEEDQREEKTEKAEETRFDKHPRWQQMLQERDQAKQIADQERIARAKLEGEIEALRRQSVPEVKKETPMEYKDLSSLSADEIAEWQATDPKGFASNLYAQVKAETLRQVQESLKAEQAAEQSRSSIERTYKEFEAKNPDFKTMWDSGEIVKFIDANPGHNPISAYQAMTYDSRMQKAIEDARLQAIRETEDKVNKNWQAKRAAKVLGSGPSGAGADTEDKELKDVKTNGGLYNVLAKRLDRLRMAAG